MNLRTLRLYSGPGNAEKSLLKVNEERFVGTLQRLMREFPNLTLNALFEQAAADAMTDLGEPAPVGVCKMEVKLI